MSRRPAWFLSEPIKTMQPPEHSRAALYCAAAVIRARQRSGQPIPDWLRQHHAQIEAEFGMSRSGHETPTTAGQLEQDELITAKEAAEVLGCTKRQCQRIAPDLNGQLIGGRWLFNRSAVVEYAEGKRDA
jgi:hypothetical protein